MKGIYNFLDMIDSKTLRFITQNGLQAFARGHILDGIAALRTLLPYCATETIIRAEADSMEENYHHMLSYLRKDGGDKKRNEVQKKIQRQGAELMEQTCRAIRLSLGNDLYSKAQDTLIQNSKFLDSIEPRRTDKVLSKIQYDSSRGENVVDSWNTLLTPEERTEAQDDLFDLIWTSPHWTAQDTARWYDFILAQRDMVQQHFMGALFLSAWEHYNAEKIQLLNLMADSECHRTCITAVTYLLLLRLRYKELISLMPSLPKSLLSRKGRKLIAQVQYEMLLMLLSENDMKKELEETEALTKKIIADLKSLKIEDIKAVVEIRQRYLRNRLRRGFDPNLSKAPLLHGCEYMKRISHWFLPFDKTHPLFQSVMIDEKGNEKQRFSSLVDLIMDCDVDKIATLYFVSNDKDFTKAVSQIEELELPDIENLVIPEYTFRFIMQDLYRFFVHSPLSSQLYNPFREEQTLMDFPDLFSLFPESDIISCCNMMAELGREKQALSLLDNLINSKGASAQALLAKGQVQINMKHYTEATSSLRAAEVLEPDNVEILRLLIECYAIQRRFEEELECLQHLAELYPDEKSYRSLIPMAMAMAGRKEEALQLFFKLEYETPEDDITLYSNIATTAFLMNKLDVAERYIKKEMQLTDGKKWFNHLRLGQIHLLRGNWKDSIESYEQFVNTYCESTGKDIKAALALLDEEQEQIAVRGVSQNDILLIRDILQASSEGNART